MSDEDKKYELTVDRLDKEKIALDTALEQQLARYDTDLSSFETYLNDKMRATADYVNAYNSMMAKLGQDGATVTAPTINPSGWTPPMPEVATLPGYASGGAITEPTLLYGLKSQKPYAIAGEAGTEYVSKNGGNTGNTFIFQNSFPGAVIRQETDIRALARQVSIENERTFQRTIRTGR
jgi:hypothetical protein